MKPVVRLGAVNYLNVRPLVYTLDSEPRVALRFDSPSECARLLDAGQVDLGMVPSIAHLDRPGDRIVPGIAIASEGPVSSVALFARRPLADVRTIALDTSSRTSAVLVRILCRRVFDIDPTYVPHGPDLEAMLAVADAALLIGDPALLVDHAGLGLEKWDLGAIWTTMTGLPFVWAFWAGRADAAGPETVAILQEAARRGTQHLDAIGAAYCGPDPARIEMAQRYLRENLIFDLDGRSIAGLRAFYREAADMGVSGTGRPIDFFAAPTVPT